MKENQPETLCVNGEDVSMGEKGVFLRSNGIVSESKNDKDEPQKALPQLEQDDPLENKSQVSPPQDDDDEKEPFHHVIVQKPDELIDQKPVELSPICHNEESKCHNPMTGKEHIGDDEVGETEKEHIGDDEVAETEKEHIGDHEVAETEKEHISDDEVAETGKEHIGDEDEVIADQKPREDKILEGQSAVSRDESCNGEDDKAKANRSILSLQDHFAEGEASFSALGFAGSSLLASVPHSGSTSLRSDSSTTSARSFAFPVLQPEWISSPVRMKKSYNRFWKHGQRWRRLLLCCRF